MMEGAYAPQESLRTPEDGVHLYSQRSFKGQRFYWAQSVRFQSHLNQTTIQLVHLIGHPVHKAVYSSLAMGGPPLRCFTSHDNNPQGS